jgi:catechol 2,3-dioxygenase-like lactoylglutathione lyase family enzyme
LGPSARCFSISTISDIALAVGDVDRAEAFYRDVLGLRRLYRFGDLTFFDCAGVRLMLEKSHSPENIPKSSVIYFRCADIALAVRELERRGVTFSSKPHLIARMDDHDLWMAFFTDPDGHTLALMQEAPKGYTPTAV